MNKNFQPLELDIKSESFSAWKFVSPEDEAAAATDEENEESVSELELLRQETIEKAYADGIAKAQSEIKTKLDELSRWIELIQKPVKLIDEALTQEIIQVVIWLCQHAIGVELSLAPEKIKAIIKEIKKELPVVRGKKTLAMNPEDIAYIQEAFKDKDVADLLEVLRADTELGRGDFYLQGEHSELDGRLQSRFISLFSKYIDNEDSIPPIQSQE